MIPPLGIKSEMVRKNRRLEITINARASVYVVAGEGSRGVPHLRAVSVSVPRGLGDALKRSPAIARVLIYGVQRSPIAV